MLGIKEQDRQCEPRAKIMRCSKTGPSAGRQAVSMLVHRLQSTEQSREEHSRAEQSSVGRASRLETPRMGTGQ